MSSSSGKLACLAFVFLNGVRFSACYAPPPMVRSYDYPLPGNDVLSLCQEAIVSLGYEIEEYESVDRYFVTRVRKIKRFFQPVEYVVFVRVDDRITVYVYAEGRTFKRASELGIKAGDLLAKDTSNNLSLKFQRAIFNPITREFAKRGFALQDTENGENGHQLASHNKDRKGKPSALRKRKKSRRYVTTQPNKKEYVLERDLARLESVIEAEHQVSFFKNDTFAKVALLGENEWSVVQINKIVISRDDQLRQVILDEMRSYPDYYAYGQMEWIIDPDGRVVEPHVTLETSFNTPEDELGHRLASTLRRLFFPPSRERSTFVRVSRRIQFSGNYSAIRFSFGRVRLVDLVRHFRETEPEDLPDTFFVNPVLLK